jgi:hypothetical protein
MNGQIFISYRREDASYPAGRLYDNLHSRFPQNEIFMDVDSIKPGIDFIETIEERVDSCDVLVAVIGKRWLSAADEEGRRRLDNPEDFVRLEVGTALKRGVLVIPVLVEGASMPRAAELPEELKPLARRNALSLSHERFRADSERLIDSVGEVLEAAAVEGPPRPPEGEQQRRGRAAGQGKTEPPQGTGAGPGAPASNRTPLEGVTAKLKRSRRLLVVIGIGVVVCLLGVGLFKVTRPQPVSIGGSSSPTPAPLAAALNSPSPTPLVSQVSPSPSPSGAEALTEAKHYLDLGDYAKALPPLQKAADAGDAVAMNSLGYLYEKGLRVAQDYSQARQWYQKAADAGNAGARQALARLPSAPSPTPSAAESLAQAQRYLDTKDFANALPLLQKAAAGGNPSAMNNLGDLYYYGRGVAQDYGKAREWYQKAADAGNTDAKRALASQSPPPQPAPIAAVTPSPPVAAGVPPKPTRYFNDYASVVDSQTAEKLNRQLADFERQTSNQILVVIYRSLPVNASIEDFALDAFRVWKPGRKGKNNGVILFIFVQDRKIRIETGLGLEQALPDSLCQKIVSDQIAPRFRTGDFNGGLAAAINSIVTATRDAYNGTGKTVAEQKAADEARTGQGSATEPAATPSATAQ